MNIREQKIAVKEEGLQMPQEMVTVKQQTAVLVPTPVPTGAAGKRYIIVRTQKHTLRYIPEQTTAKESLQSVTAQEVKTKVDVCALAAPSPTVAGKLLFN